MARKPRPQKHTPGPEPERFKVDLNFEDAAARVVRAKKPRDGWPDSKKKTRKRA
jgi:hypothetical protein